MKRAICLTVLILVEGYMKRQSFRWTGGNNCLDWANSVIDDCKSQSEGCGK